MVANAPFNDKVRNLLGDEIHVADTGRIKLCDNLHIAIVAQQLRHDYGHAERPANRTCAVAKATISHPDIRCSLCKVSIRFRLIRIIAQSFAIELLHVVIQDEGLRRHCNVRTIAESFASGTIRLNPHHITDKGAPADLVQRVNAWIGARKRHGGLQIARPSMGCNALCLDRRRKSLDLHITEDMPSKARGVGLIPCPAPNIHVVLLGNVRCAWTAHALSFNLTAHRCHRVDGSVGVEQLAIAEGDALASRALAKMESCNTREVAPHVYDNDIGLYSRYTSGLP